ncbi:MAG: hypothetical protein RQ899_08965 [Pseudomonadales bacterium]|nr:hypothetical protein [Pseudomonadales bacterium]
MSSHFFSVWTNRFNYRPRHHAGSTGTAVLGKLFFSCICLTSPALTLAQDAYDFTKLIFEPVLIEVETGEDNTPVIRELSSLPSRAPAISMASITGLGRLSSTADLVPDDVLISDDDIADPRLKPAEDASLTIETDIAQYEQAVKDMELLGGPYQIGLVQELSALADLYQQQGDHDKAIEIYERAWHIDRVNYGLFSLEQTPIVDEIIQSYLAVGDMYSADTLQEYRFQLYKKNYDEGSVELLPELARMAEWNIYAFAISPEAFRGNSKDYIDLISFRINRLLNAQNLYSNIVEILLNKSATTDPRLLDAERRLATTNYFFATNFSSSNNATVLPSQLNQNSINNPGGVSISSMGFRYGSEALERRVQHLRSLAPNDPAAIAAALVDLADWNLVFQKRNAAFELYAQAYQGMFDAGMPQESIDALLDPGIPVRIPAFIIAPFSRRAQSIAPEMALDYAGHIDVAFTLSRSGATNSVEVIGKAPDTPEMVESALLRYLKETQFRPRFQQGAPENKSPVTLRYYYTFSS